MWLECIRYRFRLDPEQDCLELAQAAALQSLRHSARCRSWRVLPSPSDPSLSILEIEWDAGPSQAPFRDSAEFAALHAALTAQVRALYEADERAAPLALRRALGGPDAVFRLAEAIVARVMRVPELAGRFHSRDGSRRARLGLWLVEVLGGPALFSSSFSGVAQGDGPVAGDPLDLDERERFLEVARDCLSGADGEPRSEVLGALRANLPLYPAPPGEAPPARALAAQRPPRFDGEELLLEDELPEERGGDAGSARPPSVDALAPRALLMAADPGPAAPFPAALPSAALLPAALEGEPPSRVEPAAAGEAETPEPGADEAARGGPVAGERDGTPTWTRRRLGRRYRAFDSGVFPHPRRQTAKR